MLNSQNIKELESEFKAVTPKENGEIRSFIVRLFTNAKELVEYVAPKEALYIELEKKEKELSAKERELQKQLALFSREKAELLSSVEQLQAAASKETDAALEMKRTYTSKLSQVSVKEAAVESRAQTLDLLQARLDEKLGEITEREAAITDKDKQQADTERELAKREEQIKDNERTSLQRTDVALKRLEERETSIMSREFAFEKEKQEVYLLQQKLHKEVQNLDTDREKFNKEKEDFYKRNVDFEKQVMEEKKNRELLEQKRAELADIERKLNDHDRA